MLCFCPILAFFFFFSGFKEFGLVSVSQQLTNKGLWSGGQVSPRETPMNAQ